MTTQTEALKSAIEFAEFCLEELDLSYMASNQAKRLVDKAKEALAQPEQEPVGVVCVDISNAHMMYGTQYLGQQPDKKTVMLFKDLKLGTQLYTTPPPVAEPHKRKPLTDEEIEIIDRAICGDREFCRAFVRAIEAEHGIKE